MADRIIYLQCPFCKKHTEVFVMIGQTREDTCEHCKKTIYFDKKGNSFQYDFKKMTTCSGKVL